MILLNNWYLYIKKYEWYKYIPYINRFRIKTISRIQSIPKWINKSIITHIDDRIYYLNEDNITYMIMTNTTYPIPAAVACLESMKKEYGSILNGRNFSKLINYGLNSELKEKLKMK